MWISLVESKINISMNILLNFRFCSFFSSNFLLCFISYRFWTCMQKDKIVLKHLEFHSVPLFHCNSNAFMLRLCCMNGKWEEEDRNNKFWIEQAFMWCNYSYIIPNCSKGFSCSLFITIFILLEIFSITSSIITLVIKRHFLYIIFFKQFENVWHARSTWVRSMFKEQREKIP